MNFWELIIAGLPGALVAAVVSFVFTRMNKRIDKATKEREAEEKRRESTRREYEGYLIQMAAATAALGKANALAIRNGKCNGETKAALEYLDTVKHNQRDFLIQHGLDDIF